MAPMIPKNELDNRVQTLQDNLIDRKLDAVFLPLGIYFEYYFGKSAKPSERIIAGIVTPDDDPFILTPAFEISNIERSTYVDDIVGWEETQSPYKLLAREFDDRGIGSDILVDPKLWIHEVEKIQNYTDRTLSSGHQLLTEQRKTKTVWEIEQLQSAAKASSEGILAAIPQLEVGMTEMEFVPILAKELGDRSGNPLSFAIVQFGENSAIPHGQPTDKKLTQDSVILIDAGTSVNGYHGDITITIPFGNPNDFEKIYEIVYKANREAYENEKAGMIAAKLDEIARDHITSKNYGKYFTHRLGHGIGMEVHEEPYIVGSNKLPLKINNCHTIEPGIYIPNKFGIRIEDDIVLTEDGAERLYNTPRHNFDLI